MFMKSAVLLAFILLFSFMHAAWTESLEVHVVDAKNRPLKGAVIEIKYQKNNFPIYRDSNLDGHSTLITDETGRVDFTFSNNVDNNLYEIRYYYLSANYSGEYQSEKIVCSTLGERCHSKTYLKTFFMDAYRVTVYVRDQKQRPISNAVVRYAGMEYETDSNGMAWVNVLNKKSYSISVEYEGKKRTVQGKINGNDEIAYAIIPRYNIRLRVVDDNGNVMHAEAMLNNITKESDENGYITFEKILSDNVEVLVRYKGGFRKVELALSDDVDMDVVVDETPPTIVLVSKEADEDENAIIISASIRDPGSKGSGLRESDPARLRYKIGNEGWSSVSMYQTGKDAFQATIPLKYDVKINFEIEAFDAQGNAQSYVDSIIVKSTGKIESEKKDGEEEKPEEVKEKSGIDIVTLIAGIIIFLVILLIIYKKYTGEI